MSERPDWGIFKPKCIHQITGVWKWMREHPEEFIVFDEIMDFAISKWRRPPVSNELSNWLCRYPKAFEKGQLVHQVGRTAGNKYVHEWKAIYNE